MGDAKKLLAGAALALMAWLPGCDADEGAPPTGMALQVFTSSEGPDPFDGVALIRLIMEGDGLLAPFTQVVPYQPGMQVSLDGVPFSGPGQKRQLVVEGWAVGSTGQPSALISRGRSLPVEIRLGQEMVAFDVLLARVNTFQALASAQGGSTQRLAEGRVGHTATLAPNGEVVIAGGGEVTTPGAAWWGGSAFTRVIGTVEAVTERTHTVQARAPLLLPRAWHTATALSSGQLILAGGYAEGGAPVREVELYNPPNVLDGTAKPLQPLATPRAGHTATMIDEAQRLILFVGGDAQGTWELWDPTVGSHGLEPLPDGAARRHHSATTFFLPDRTQPAVLIAGGESDTAPHATSMLYDSVQQSLIPVGQAMPAGSRTQHTAVLVPERGFIYVIGGFSAVDRTSARAGIDVFDVPTASFLPNNEGFRLRTARGASATALLPNNTVVITGGYGAEPSGAANGPLRSIEVIHEFVDAAQGVLRIEIASSWTPERTASVVPYMPQGRVGHRAVALGNGMTLVIGGAERDTSTGGYQLVRDLVLYNPL